MGRRAFGWWIGSILVDADHYLWFCVRHGPASPLTAARYFGGAQPARRASTRLLHSPVALSIGLALGARRREAMPIALGMGLHVALDVLHDARLRAARTRALQRDQFTCQACGTRGAHVGTHLTRQPRLLPSYRVKSLVSLCGSCHDAAHEGGGPPTAGHLPQTMESSAPATRRASAA
jgi:hypothetical protein